MQDELRNFPQLTGTGAASSLQARGRVGGCGLRFGAMGEPQAPPEAVF
jgi:hypothetical protein